MSNKLDWTKTNMRYNRLGNSGLKVSALSFGSWTTFGTETQNGDSCYECMTRALKGGVNFFDNAEAYAGGQSEIEMGKILKRWFEEGLCKRSDIVISTKIYWGGQMAGVTGNPNATGLSRKHIIEGLNDSLARLGLDYVDLVFCHRPDPQTPIAETVRAMNTLIEQGKAFYWGTSEWSAAELTEAIMYANQHGLIAPTMEQPQYNLLKRERVEVEYQNLYVKHGLGTTIWSPLASGLLTGKYSGKKVPEDSRLAQKHNSYFSGGVLQAKSYDINDIDVILERIDQLEPIANKLNCTRAQLALAWCMSFPHCSTVITGASRPSQVDENLKAMEVLPKLSPAILREIEDVMQTAPNTGGDMGRGELKIRLDAAARSDECRCTVGCRCKRGKCSCATSCKCSSDCACGGKCEGECKCGSSCCGDKKDGACKCGSDCACGGKCEGECKCEKK